MKEPMGARFANLRRRDLAVAALIVLAMSALLLAEGRHAICTCGRIELWHPRLDSGNSQHLFDWYSPSHVIHGFLFYLIGWLALRDRPLDTRFVLAVAIEALWELAENSPAVIDRYCTATMALGYTGDTVVNSVADVAAMMTGFALAARLPVRAIVALAIAFELVTLAVIRDNLTLNVLMLIAPVDAIRIWQSGA